MALLLAIDPGVVTGWAAFSDNKLGVDGQFEWRLYAFGFGATWPKTFQYRAIIEKPQVYPHTGAKQANDLIMLAIMVGEYKSQFPSVELVLPHTWKGNTPKPVHHVRVWEALEAYERNQLGECQDYIEKCYACVHGERKTAPTSKVHNLLDAVGLGLWKLQRLR